MQHIQNNGGAAYDNDLSSHSNTVNHIHLHPSAITTEYDTWLKQTGSLLQTAAIHASLQPLLQLLVLALGPERIFVLPYTTTLNNTKQHYTEIIIITDTESINEEAAQTFTNIAAFKMQQVHIVVHTVEQMEAGLAASNLYYTIACRERFLVFSGSPYKLQPVLQEQQALAASARESFQQSIANINELFKTARAAKKQEAVTGLIILRSVMEQLCRTVLYSFGEKDIFFTSLWQLMQPCIFYLPALEVTLPEKKILDALDNVSVYHANIFSGFDEATSITTLFDVAEAIIINTTEAFESKLMLLSG
ncbi:hypothetical protein [Parafilimonas sp.]|uniref:hypothetical protein n=1 Tax=Parafilimonas sp. TaxID=1969739 RepID=UPI003F7D2CB2